VEPEGVADRDGDVADLHRSRVGKPERLHTRWDLLRVDADHGKIARRVGANDVRLDRVAVGSEPEGTTLPRADDVRIRHDRAVAIDDEACSGPTVGPDRHDSRARDP